MSKYTGNIYKSFYLVPDNEGPRVIDNNSVIEQKLDKLREAYPGYDEDSYNGGYDGDYADGYEDGFQGGLDADALDVLTLDSYGEGEEIPAVIKAEPEDTSDESPVGDGLDALMAEPSYDGPTPEELVAKAQEEIAAMKADAEAEIEYARQAAYDEGKHQGYVDGHAEAQEELDQARQELEVQKHLMETDYEAKVADLEPQFVHHLTRIYEKIFEVDFSEHKTLVLALLRNTMSNIPTSKNYMVHVSRDDYKLVNERKELLLRDTAAEGTTLDIIEDATLKANECMIETSSGIYDCSLGTELKALRKRLELLSYTVD